MDMSALETALVAHEQSDRVIDVAQSVGIGVCAIGIIVSCLALIYVAFLLRAAATTLTKDMRAIMDQIAINKVRLDQIEVTLGLERRSGETDDAIRREAP
jgi:hypothetical protein